MTSVISQSSLLRTRGRILIDACFSPIDKISVARFEFWNFDDARNLKMKRSLCSHFFFFSTILYSVDIELPWAKQRLLIETVEHAAALDTLVQWIDHSSYIVRYWMSALSFVTWLMAIFADLLVRDDRLYRWLKRAYSCFRNGFRWINKVLLKWRMISWVNFKHTSQIKLKIANTSLLEILY